MSTGSDGSRFDGRSGAGTNIVFRGGTFHDRVYIAENIVMQMPRALDPAMHGLPPRASSFTGRTDVMERLLAVLAPRSQEAGTVVAAVAGLPGVGKTELVLQVADHACRQEGWFPGGVLFVDLQGYRSPDIGGPLSAPQVLRSFLTALGVSTDHLPDDVQDLARIYRSALTAYADRSRRVLVVVDNAVSAGQVLPLLPGDPRIPVLVTSRHTLSDLTNVTLHDLAPLAPGASLELLREELRRKRGPEYGRVEEEAEDAARIADACGHLPLALQIISAVLADAPERALVALADELQNATSPLDGLERETRGVRAAFDLSYAMLPADQSRAFRLLWLSVYDTISTHAAARVLDTTVSETRRLLRALARANLLRNTGQDGDRWSMHDLLAAHADELRSAETAIDHSDAAVTRLIDYYLHTAAEADCYLAQPGDDTLQTVLGPAPPTNAETPGDPPLIKDADSALLWLDQERDNLITTVLVTRAAEANLLVVALASTLSRYLDLRHDRIAWVLVADEAATAAEEEGDPGLIAEAADMLGSALLGANRPEEAVPALFRAAELYDGIESFLAKSHALSLAGSALQDLHRFAEAIEAHDAAREAYRQSGNTVDDPRLLRRYGSTLRAAGRSEEALAAHNAALAAQSTKNHEEEAVALNNIANALSDAGHTEEAEAAYLRAIEHSPHSAAGSRQSHSLNGLAVHLHEQHRSTEALEVLERAREAALATGDRHQEIRALFNCGLITGELGRTGEAFEILRTAGKKAHESGDDRLEAEILVAFSSLLCTTGRPAEAVAYAENALRLSCASGDRHGEGVALNILSDALHDVGDVERCITVRKMAAAAYEEVGEPRLASTTALLGLHLFDAERWSEAIQSLERAVELYCARGDDKGAPLSLLAMALTKAQRFEEAVGRLTQALDLLSELALSGDEEATWEKGRVLLRLGHTLEHLGRQHERVTAYARAAQLYQSLGDRDQRRLALSCLYLARQAAGTAGWRGWWGWLRLRVPLGAKRQESARADSLRYRTVVDPRIIQGRLLLAVCLFLLQLTVPGVPFALRVISVLLQMMVLEVMFAVTRVARRFWQKLRARTRRAVPRE